MSAIDNVPDNKNFLSPLNFSFVLKRSPNLNFFVQQINIPGLTAEPFDTRFPNINIPFTAERINYEPLEISFRVDEDLQNYLEISNWIRGLVYPDRYRVLEDGAPTGDGLKSDISVIISDALKNPNYDLVFRDAFPTTLSGLQFQTTDESVNYIAAAVTFSYLSYDIVKI